MVYNQSHTGYDMTDYPLHGNTFCPTEYVLGIEYFPLLQLEVYGSQHRQE